MIAIVGCGNLARQDDGVGPEVIRALRNRGLDRGGVKLLDAGTDGMSVMFAARGCRTLIIVDASRTGTEPGAIYAVPGSEVERAYSAGFNLHDFRWDSALHAGRQIFRDTFPTDVTVFLIEAGELGFGIGLSPPVADAAARIAVRIAGLIASRDAVEAGE